MNILKINYSHISKYLFVFKSGYILRLIKTDRLQRSNSRLTVDKLSNKRLYYCWKLLKVIYCNILNNKC